MLLRSSVSLCNLLIVLAQCMVQLDNAHGQIGVDVGILVAEKVWTPTCQGASAPLEDSCRAEASAATAPDAVARCSDRCQDAIDLVYTECAGTVGQNQDDRWNVHVAPRLQTEIGRWGCQAKSKSGALTGSPAFFYVFVLFVARATI
eukprot:SAG31_NODE_6753_length_1898_cov_1.431907_1_plen_147_part_00